MTIHQWDSGISMLWVSCFNHNQLKNKSDIALHPHWFSLEGGASPPSLNDGGLSSCMGVAYHLVGSVS